MCENAIISNTTGRRIDNSSYAWRAFTEQFSPLIFSTIKNKIKNLCVSASHADISDIHQEVMILLWQKLESLAGVKKINNWIIKTTKNKTIDYIRSKYFQTSIKSTALCESYLKQCYPLRKIYERELNAEVSFFIENLPFMERRISILKFFYDLKYRQIAAIIDVPVATIFSAIKRIRTALIRQLQQKGYI